MKRHIKLITFISAASLLAIGAPAQESPKPNPSGIEKVQQPRPQVDVAPLNGVVRAGSVIGKPVRNYQNEELGTVDNLALDVESGRVAQVILTSGGFLSVGGTMTAVPPEAFRRNPTGNGFNLDASKDTFKMAPKFNGLNWHERTQPKTLTEVYTYFGAVPYFTTNPDEYKTEDLGEKTPVKSPGNDGGRLNAKAAGSLPRLGYVQKTSKLRGMPVENLQGEKLGEVENFMVDISAGRIAVVIVASGGFMGMGYALNAVPPTALRFNAAHDVLQIDASKEMFAASPHFKSNSWPNFRDADYLGKVYRAFSVAPYFDGDSTVADGGRGLPD